MSFKEILNRLGGSAGCDLIKDTLVHEFPQGVASIIIAQDAVIASIKDKHGVVDASGYIAHTLPQGLQITFAKLVVEIQLTSGEVVTYFS